MSRIGLNWSLRAVGMSLVAVALSSGGRVEAQEAAGCTLQKQVYTCDRAQFRQSLAHAETAQVDPLTPGKDRMVTAKLHELIASLGKAAPVEGKRADLTFSLIRVDSAGVMVGPAGVELAVLRVYGPPARRGPDTSGAADGQPAKGQLLWAESFTGQPDLSWPATVQATINQFRAEFKR